MSETSKHRSAVLPLVIGFAALGILVGAVGIWSVQARIAGAVIASGSVQVKSNRQIVQHPQGGVVGAILAKDGDRVDAGAVIVRLDDTLLRSELAVIDGQLFEILARKTRLVAERDNTDSFVLPPELDTAQNTQMQELIEGQKRLFQARKDSLTQELWQLDEQKKQTANQIAGTQAQLEAMKTQRELIEAELTDAQRLLDKGLAQASRVSALQREEARIMGEVGNLQSTIAQLKGQIAALNIQGLRLQTARREEAITTIHDLQYREIELAERRLSTLEMLAKMDIRAPVAGVIYGSQIFGPGAVISPAEPIMYVVPQDQPLVVAARIDTIHIDQVHIGQHAFLRFASFDQRTTPELDGVVSNLSADSFVDELTGMSYYQVELLPKDGEIAKLGDRQLLPGMPVDAFIKTGDRSPLSYLAKPLTEYFVKAFREG